MESEHVFHVFSNPEIAGICTLFSQNVPFLSLPIYIFLLYSNFSISSTSIFKIEETFLENAMLLLHLFIKKTSENVHINQVKIYCLKNAS